MKEEFEHLCRCAWYGTIPIIFSWTGFQYLAEREVGTISAFVLFFFAIAAVFGSVVLASDSTKSETKQKKSGKDWGFKCESKFKCFPI